MTAFFDRADRSLRTARLALTDGDTSGAADRAYYAAFDAARGLLISLGVEALAIRTHSGLWTSFAEHVIPTGLIEPDVAKAARRAERERLMADYTLISLDTQTVATTLTMVETFIDACRTCAGRSTP